MYQAEFWYHSAQMILDTEERKEADDGLKEPASEPTFQQAIDEIDKAYGFADALMCEEKRARIMQKKGEMIFEQFRSSQDIEKLR